MSLNSAISSVETYSYLNNQLVETTPDFGTNYRYFIGVKKLSRFKFEKKPKFYYDGLEENASLFRSPVDNFEYLLQYERIKHNNREYENHNIWFRYIGDFTSFKIESSNNGYIDLKYKSIDLRLKADLGGLRGTFGSVVRYHPIYGLDVFKFCNIICGNILIS